MFNEYEDEIWEEISGYPNYEVSNFGRIWSVRRDRPLNPFNDKDGYQIVSLFRHGKRTDIKVHRLVALAFLPFRAIAIEVNHGDGDKSYNYVENLEWNTHQENMSHAFDTGLSKKISLRIIETNEVFESITACARAIDGNISAISECLRGIRKKHRGYHFEIIEERR